MYAGVSASIGLGWPQTDGDFMGIDLDEGRFRFTVYRPRGDGMRAVETVSYDQRQAEDGLQTTTRVEKAPPEAEEYR